MRAEARVEWLEEGADTATPTTARRIAEVVANDGDIDVLCPKNLTPSSDPVHLAFQACDPLDPPFSVRIKAPSGKVIVERVLRDDVCGRSRGGQALGFRPEVAGDYRIEIKQVYGALRGQAILRVRFG